MSKLCNKVAQLHTCNWSQIVGTALGTQDLSSTNPGKNQMQSWTLLIPKPALKLEGSPLCSVGHPMPLILPTTGPCMASSQLISTEGTNFLKPIREVLTLQNPVLLTKKNCWTTLKALSDLSPCIVIPTKCHIIHHWGLENLKRAPFPLRPLRRCWRRAHRSLPSAPRSRCSVLAIILSIMKPFPDKQVTDILNQHHMKYSQRMLFNA